MNKIDEIALRVAANGIGRMVSNVDICDFANALLAELSEDAEPAMTYLGKGIIDCGEHGHHNMEMHKLIPAGTPLFTSHAPVIASEQKPVAWVIECEEYNLEGKRPILREIDYFNEIVDKLPAGTKLFTSPPNIEDIEQRVAEACAKLIVSDNGKCDSHVIASQLVCGEWRKYLLPSKNKWTAP